MPEIMTTRDVSKYLKLHELTICKYAARGKIPAVRIGKSWRFDKDAIDKWIGGNQNKAGGHEDTRRANILMKRKK